MTRGGEGDVAIGRVFARTFGVVRTHPVTVLGAALLLGALPQYGLDLLRVGVIHAEARGLEFGLGGGITLWLVSLALGLALTMVVQGAIVRAVVAHADGERAGPGRALLTGLRRAVPLAAMGIVSGIAIAIGFGLLFVPGVMLFVMWAVAGPALVAEGRGVLGALGRSQDLTREVRWRVLGIELLAWVGYYLAAAVLEAVGLSSSLGATWMLASAGAGAPSWLAVVSVAMSTLRIALWSALQASLYVELRDRLDGPGDQALATIFD